MNSQELFEQFNVSGQLRLPTETIQFGGASLEQTSRI